MTLGGFYHGFSPILSEAEIEAIRHRSWRIDCPSMTLQSHKSQQATSYSGPGWIAISEDGRLSFQLYASKETGSARLSDSLGPAGQIIPDEAYYDLSAQDEGGRVWRSERFLPTTSTTASGDTIVRGYLYDMSSESEFPPGPRLPSGSLNYWLFDDIEIPTNATTSVRKSIARGQLRARALMRNAWRFRSRKIGFVVVKEADDMLTIRASLRDSEPQECLPSLVMEAFQFVLGQPMQWTVMRLRRGTAFRTTICSRQPLSLKGRFHPPLPLEFVHGPGRGKITTEFHRRLFDRFLKHALERGPSCTVLGGMLGAVQESGSARFIDADALTLTVVIESLLRAEFSDLGILTDDETVAAESIRHHLESWTGNQHIKTRSLSLLGMLKDPGPVAKMKELEADGLVTSEQYKAWQDLRNLSAHRYLASGKPGLELYELLAKCQVLFYHLIFAAIGYKGPYRDYATPGWPLRRFPERTTW